MRLLKAFFLSMTSLAVYAHAPEQKSAGHSHDMSKMWAEMSSRPSGMAVSVAADEKGVLWLAQMREGRIRVSRSEDNGGHFSDAVAVNALQESILAEGQNRPQIAVRNGIVAVAWSQALPKTFTGNIRFSRSVDGGKSFSAPITINDINEDVGHGFAALTMSDDGRIALAWIDGRDKAPGSAIYYAVSDDSGAHFSENKKLTGDTCECCRIAVTTDSDGVPVVFWRHLFAGGIRDFALARLQEKTTVVRASNDNWAINACPHHGGDIAADEKGGLHLAWFTGSLENPGLFYRRLDAEHMTTPHAFGDPDTQAGYPAVFAQGQAVYLAWREFDGNSYRLMAARSGDRGEHWSSARVVATSAGKADIPEFVVDAQQALLVWNGEADGLRIFEISTGWSNL